MSEAKNKLSPSLLSLKSIITWIGMGLLRIISLLPYEILMIFGDSLGLLIHKLSPHRKEISAININRCLQKEGDELNRFVKSNFQAVGRGVFEMAIGWWASDQKIKNIKTRIINGHLFERDGIHLSKVKIGKKVILSGFTAVNQFCNILFNRSIQGIFYQIVTLSLVILAIIYIVDNTARNMVARGLASGFHFLGVEAQFDIQMTLIEYSPTSTYFDSFIVGLLNTLLVAGLGIFVATIVGFAVGIARLSSNYLIRNTAAWYVEFFRNIPLLLQIFFWYYAALRALPLPQDAEPLFGVSYPVSYTHLTLPTKRIV